MENPNQELIEYINQQLKPLERGLIATPKTREALDNFAESNGGSMDLVLSQMSVQYGYQLAYSQMLEHLKTQNNGK
jgi:hypothetical protein